VVAFLDRNHGEMTGVFNQSKIRATGDSGLRMVHCEGPEHLTVFRNKWLEPGGTYPPLDGPAAIPPNVHIDVRSKLPWVTLPEGAPSFEAYYDSQKLWPAVSLERRRAILR
jgi:hypothetical protein